jgi:probable HAF family extracellular repeat protein
MFMPRCKRNLHIVAMLVAIAELIPAKHTLAQTTAYIISDLTNAGVPCQLNNLGDFVGRGGVKSVGGQTRATTWSHGTLAARILGILGGGEYSSGSAINDAGEVAGVSNIGNAIVPFIWSATGGLQRVPLLSGDNCGQAISINKYGHVVGYSSGRNGAKAFFWTRTTSVRNLGVLPGGNYSKARDLNDRDEVVGTSGSAAGDRAYLWSPGGSMQDLGTLPGDTSSEATAINNNGDVVGYSKGPRGMRAFIWTKVGGMQEIGVLPGGTSSRALDISDIGEVVGSSTSASGDHAFIWTKTAGMVDLNSASSANLGVVLIEAHAINSRGQIIVMGGDVNGTPASDFNQHCAPAPPSSFLLTPVASR